MLGFRSALRNSVFGGFGLAVVAVLPAAAQVMDLGPVNVPSAGADPAAARAATVASAPYQAPSQAPLQSIQPTSVVNRNYIENQVAPTANYDEMINITPSVSSVAPNGPGLAEEQFLTIRGFQDGQYNVTFDGIPWGDSNDFTHHTTSYFMAHDIGQTIVDRGPGTASTIGNATFGGTVSILSKDPNATRQYNPYASYGSFNTALMGLEFDTGHLESLNGGSGFIDAQGLFTDGYLTNMSQDRKNVFAKFIVPVTDSTTLTFVAMYNTLHQNISLGATKAEIAKFGPNYALSTDPTMQNYFNFNYDEIQTDFEYVGLTSNLGDGFSVDNKLYTYAYYHRGSNGEDPNGTLPNGTAFGANNVPGNSLVNDYRSFGDTLRFKKETAIGDLLFGTWVDHQINHRELFEVDYSLGGKLNPINVNLPAGSDVDHYEHDTLDSIQPYVQFDIKPLDGLTISPGIKYNYFQRHLDALVNNKTLAPSNNTGTYSLATPSISANYRVTDNLAVYAQAAEGFQAPKVNVFYVPTPEAGSHVNPQQSWNYQAGAAYRSQRLTLSGDAYYIDFSNMINSRTVGANTTFYNLGGVIYKGLEAEAALYVGSGFTVFTNGSVNSAIQRGTHMPIANAPDATAAGGVLFQKDNYSAALIEKWVGSRYGDVNKQQGLQPYGVLNGSVGYEHFAGEGPSWLPPSTIRLIANNLLNTRVITDLAGYAVGDGTTPLYWTQPGRSFFVTVSAKF